ncbi:MAG: D-Ala-D-Ala carboxypeptidase family metallohydrolase [Myxococcota bacterium]
MWFVLACQSPGALRVAPNGLVAEASDESTSGTSTDSTSTSETDGTSGTSGTNGTSGTSTSEPSSTTDPTSTSTTSPGSDTGAVADTVCYPGPSYAYDVCFGLVEPNPLPVEYEYPPPLDGSAQYAAPSRYLDLESVDPYAQIAPNFTLDEFAAAYKGPYGVVQVHAVEVVQDLRDELGALVVNSGYRSPDYNAGLGGATWSRHMYGDGVDLDPVDATLDELADACAAHGADYVGVYEAHIHCDWRDTALDPAFYPSTFAGARVAPRPVPSFAASVVQRGAVLEAPAEGWDEGEPLREWTALDSDGAVVGTGVGRLYRPPPGAVEVEVVVGRAVTVVSPLTAP